MGTQIANAGVEKEVAAEASSSESNLVAGRYLAENGRWFVQLRVELGGHPTVSADLSSRDQYGPLELWVKTRPLPGSLEAEGRGALKADWLDGRGAFASGTIALEPIDDHLLKATFTLEQALGGLDPRFTLTVTATRISTALRDVGLEIEREFGQDFDLRAKLGRDVVEVKTVLHYAGIDVHEVGQETIIPTPAAGRLVGVGNLHSPSRPAPPELASPFELTCMGASSARAIQNRSGGTAGCDVRLP